MNIIQAIQSRRSIRTYNGLRLDETIIAGLRRQIHTILTNIPAGFNNIPLPDIIIVNDIDTDGHLGTYGVISGARTYAILACQPTSQSQLLAAYLFEQFIIHCTAQSIATCWLGGTFSHTAFQKAYTEAIHTTPSPQSSQTHPESHPVNQIACVTPLGHATPKTRFADRLMRRIARSDHRKPFTTLFSGIPAPAPSLLTTQPSPTNSTTAINIQQSISLALEMVRLAPSSRNSQPWRATVTTTQPSTIPQSTITFTCATSNPFSHIDMGIALYHFHATLLTLGLTPRLTLLPTPTFHLP